MALTKVTRSGITDNSVNAAKIEDGTVVDADITPGTLTAAKLASTLDLSSKTVTLPNTSVTNGMLAGSIANAKLANSSITINGSATALGGSVSAGSLAWQSVVVSDGSTVTTMVAGRGYFVNNTSAAGIVKLPAAGTAGDTIAIKDYAGNFGTNKLTIQRNGHNIQGIANNSQIGTNRASVVLVYIDATKGWLYTNESNVGDLQEATFISATGGTITTSGDYRIHSFTGDGNFVVASIGNPLGGPNTADYLVVGGGGSAGFYSSGGGGAGGFRESSGNTGSYTASPLKTPTGIAITAQTYPITVGAGAPPSSPWPYEPGTQGTPSNFSTITSAGGGGGGGGNQAQPQPGLPGGSGGGGSSPNNHPGTFPGGSGNQPPVSPPQGNNGGTGSGSPGSGGGGGATAVGGNNGNGGAGATTHITGSPVAYAGGGGGCGNSGGTGGGGSSPCATRAGTANTGGGGNGGAAGGKGIVILRYKYQ